MPSLIVSLTGRASENRVYSLCAAISVELILLQRAQGELGPFILQQPFYHPGSTLACCLIVISAVVICWREWLNKKAQRKFAAKLQPLIRERNLFLQFIGVYYAVVGLAEVSWILCEESFDLDSLQKQTFVWTPEHADCNQMLALMFALCKPILALYIAGVILGSFCCFIAIRKQFDRLVSSTQKQPAPASSTTVSGQMLEEARSRADPCSSSMANQKSWMNFTHQRSKMLDEAAAAEATLKSKAADLADHAQEVSRHMYDLTKRITYGIAIFWICETVFSVAEQLSGPVFAEQMVAGPELINLLGCEELSQMYTGRVYVSQDAQSTVECPATRGYIFNVMNSTHRFWHHSSSWLAQLDESKLVYPHNYSMNNRSTLWDALNTDTPVSNVCLVTFEHSVAVCCHGFWTLCNVGLLVFWSKLKNNEK